MDFECDPEDNATPLDRFMILHTERPDTARRTVNSRGMIERFDPGYCRVILNWS